MEAIRQSINNSSSYLLVSQNKVGVLMEKTDAIYICSRKPWRHSEIYLFAGICIIFTSLSLSYLGYTKLGS